MNVLINIYIYLIYIYNKLSEFFPYTNIKLFKQDKIIDLNFMKCIIFNLVNYFNSSFFNKKINEYFKNYEVLYKKNNKIYISKTFIINKKSNSDNSCFFCSQVDKILIKNQNSVIDFLKLIKNYDMNIKIDKACMINNIKIEDIDHISIEYFPFCKIPNKELNSEQFKNENLEFLLKN